MDPYIIRQALLNYDEHLITIKHLKKTCNYKIEPSEADTKRSKIFFYDKKTNDLILQTDFEILGGYYLKYKIWIWSWALLHLKNNLTILSRELLNYSFSAKEPYNVDKYLSRFITSKSIIGDKTQFDINIALASFIIRQPYIYKIHYGNSLQNIHYEYIILINNEDLEKLHKSLIKKR